MLDAIDAPIGGVQCIEGVRNDTQSLGVRGRGDSLEVVRFPLFVKRNDVGFAGQGRDGCFGVCGGVYIGFVSGLCGILPGQRIAPAGSPSAETAVMKVAWTDDLP